MAETLIATATETIDASPSQVWDALTNPTTIKQYFFGADVISEWKEGSPIVYKGEWKGQKFEDKGRVVKIDPERILVCTHWSPLSGTPDRPENYHQVTYSLRPEGDGTILSIRQDNNATENERRESAQNWQSMLKSMKAILEK